MPLLNLTAPSATGVNDGDVVVTTTVNGVPQAQPAANTATDTTIPGTRQCRGMRAVITTNAASTISGTWWATASGPDAVSKGTAVYSADTRAAVALTAAGAQQDVREFTGARGVYFVPSAVTGAPTISLTLIPLGG